MHYPSAHIIVFAKAPTPGHCKTRLGRVVGMHRAAEIHRQLTDITLLSIKDKALAPASLYCDGDLRHVFFQRQRRQHELTLRKQSQGDLGQRMYQAFRESLATSSAVLIVGTDCPLIGPSHLEQALDFLHGDTGAVFLPTEDGGYALVGLSKPEPHLFRRIDWGSPKVMQQTRHRLRQTGLRWVELPSVWDIDEATDFRRARRAGLLRS